MHQLVCWQEKGLSCEHSAHLVIFFVVSDIYRAGTFSNAAKEKRKGSLDKLNSSVSFLRKFLFCPTSKQVARSLTWVDVSFVASAVLCSSESNGAFFCCMTPHVTLTASVNLKQRFTEGKGVKLAQLAWASQQDGLRISHSGDQWHQEKHVFGNFLLWTQGCAKLLLILLKQIPLCSVFTTFIVTIVSTDFVVDFVFVSICTLFKH